MGLGGAGLKFGFELRWDLARARRATALPSQAHVATMHLVVLVHGYGLERAQAPAPLVEERDRGARGGVHLRLLGRWAAPFGRGCRGRVFHRRCRAGGLARLLRAPRRPRPEPQPQQYQEQGDA